MSTNNFLQAKDHATKEIVKRFEILCATRSKWAYFSKVWHFRRMFNAMDMLFRGN